MGLCLPIMMIGFQEKSVYAFRCPIGGVESHALR